MPRSWFRAGLATAAAGLLLSWPAAAIDPGLKMLSSLEKGAWLLRPRDGGAERRLCLRTGRELIQLEHRGAACSPFVVEDAPDHVVVQYTCRGRGYGRTTVRRESAALVQVQSRGISDGAPFAVDGEARHHGPC